MGQYNLGEIVPCVCVGGGGGGGGMSVSMYVCIRLQTRTFFSTAKLNCGINFLVANIDISKLGPNTLGEGRYKPLKLTGVLQEYVYKCICVK